MSMIGTEQFISYIFRLQSLNVNKVQNITEDHTTMLIFLHLLDS